MTEQWIRWEPFSHLKSHYYLEVIDWNWENFTILLAESNHSSRKIQVLFQDFVEVYRCFKYHHNQLIHPHQWTFFKVINSSYNAWLQEESLTVVAPNRLTHFAFVTINARVDVLTYREPLLKILTHE